MKKIILTLSVIALILVGCRKEYTCTCVKEYETTTSVRYNEAKTTKSKAEEWCYDYKIGLDSLYECELTKN